MLPVLLLHSVTRDKTDFEDFAPLVSSLARPLKPCPVDHIGHGDAVRADRYRITDFADGIVLPRTPFALYGHSLGGMVALCIAARHPDLVEAVVLEDPPLFDSKQPRLDATHWADGFRKLKSLMAGRGASWGEAEWQRAAVHWPSGHGSKTISQAGGPKAAERRGRQIVKLDPNVLDAMVADTLHEGFDVIASLRAACCAVTILAGDRAAGSALTDEDLRLLAPEPNVTLVHAHGVGHYVREADPRLCVRALEAAVAT
ncbi:MAG: alpha/beta hydrolase [Pseudomonadota bacterium]